MKPPFHPFYPRPLQPIGRNDMIVSPSESHMEKAGVKGKYMKS